MSRYKARQSAKSVEQDFRTTLAMMLCTRSAPGPYESSSALTKGRNWNTQYTRGPLSTLRRSLPFGFLRLALFGHVIAPDVIQPSSENTANRQRGQYDLDVEAVKASPLSWPCERAFRVCNITIDSPSGALADICGNTIPNSDVFI